MARTRGTDRNGRYFDQDTVRAVWNKGREVTGVDPTQKRKDVCGAWIEWGQYGVTHENGTGWEIDHIVPLSQGGADSLNNLQPLQWENNRSKGNDYPDWSCEVSASN
jgi:5-methylcytosine-specific restriction endonuclease McrA